MRHRLKSVMTVAGVAIATTIAATAVTVGIGIVIEIAMITTAAVAHMKIPRRHRRSDRLQPQPRLLLLLRNLPQDRPDRLRPGTTRRPMAMSCKMKVRPTKDVMI